jgi:hypothetical protein
MNSRQRRRIRNRKNNKFGHHILIMGTLTRKLEGGIEITKETEFILF